MSESCRDAKPPVFGAARRGPNPWALFDVMVYLARLARRYRPQQPVRTAAVACHAVGNAPDLRAPERPVKCTLFGYAELWEVRRYRPDRTGEDGQQVSALVRTERGLERLPFGTALVALSRFQRQSDCRLSSPKDQDLSCSLLSGDHRIARAGPGRRVADERDGRSSRGSLGVLLTSQDQLCMSLSPCPPQAGRTEPGEGRAPLGQDPARAGAP